MLRWDSKEHAENEYLFLRRQTNLTAPSDSTETRKGPPGKSLTRDWNLAETPERQATQNAKRIWTRWAVAIFHRFKLSSYTSLLWTQCDFLADGSKRSSKFKMVENCVKSWCRTASTRKHIIKNYFQILLDSRSSQCGHRKGVLFLIVEDIGHVLIEHYFMNFLFLLFFSFFSPLFFTAAVSWTPSESQGLFAFQLIGIRLSHVAALVVSHEWLATPTETMPPALKQ